VQVRLTSPHITRSNYFFCYAGRRVRLTSSRRIGDACVKVAAYFENRRLRCRAVRRVCGGCDARLCDGDRGRWDGGTVGTVGVMGVMAVVLRVMQDGASAMIMSAAYSDDSGTEMGQARHGYEKRWNEGYGWRSNGDGIRGWNAVKKVRVGIGRSRLDNSLEAQRPSRMSSLLADHSSAAVSVSPSHRNPPVPLRSGLWFQQHDLLTCLPLTTAPHHLALPRTPRHLWPVSKSRRTRLGPC
jgi:hypothetical protein